MTEMDTKDHSLLATVMQGCLVAAFVCGLGGAFIPGTAGHWSAIACIAMLVAAPVFRVIWLTVDWATEGDRRFALLGCALLVVVVCGGVIALLH